MTIHAGWSPAPLALAMGSLGELPLAGEPLQVCFVPDPAVTALLDRLERQGFIERRRDQSDRRRVVVVSNSAMRWSS